MAMFEKSKTKTKPVAFIQGKSRQDDEFVNLQEDGVKSVLTSQTTLRLMPSYSSSGRRCIYVAGASGSGKSYWTAQYIRDWIRFNNKKTDDKMVYIFSALNADPVFDKIIDEHPNKVHRVNVNADLLNDPIGMDEIEKGSLLIFDDIDVLGTKLRKYIYDVINQVLQIGRHFDLSIIITSHLINGTDRNFNRIVMNESHYVVLFLHGLARKHVKYWADTYAGLDTTDLKQLYKLAGRSVVFHKNYPQFYILDTKIIPLRIE
jgi:hypothetical protein